MAEWSAPIRYYRMSLKSSDFRENIQDFNRWQSGKVLCKESGGYLVALKNGRVFGTQTYATAKQSIRRIRHNYQFMQCASNRVKTYGKSGGSARTVGGFRLRAPATIRPLQCDYRGCGRQQQRERSSIGVVPWLPNRFIRIIIIWRACPARIVRGKI